MADATVSKTVGGQPPCRFESDLRHRRWPCPPALPGGVAVAQRTLDPLALVRIQARQPEQIEESRTPLEKSGQGCHNRLSGRLSYSPVAQLVEWAAVNRLVAGSSPARGARLVSESVPQIHIKKATLFRVDARTGLFLCCPGQGWPGCKSCLKSCLPFHSPLSALAIVASLFLFNVCSPSNSARAIMMVIDSFPWEEVVS
jgi:hypothetical protein